MWSSLLQEVFRSRFAFSPQTIQYFLLQFDVETVDELFSRCIINYANQTTHRIFDTWPTKNPFHSWEENFTAVTKFSSIKIFKPKREVFTGKNPHLVAILLQNLNTFYIPIYNWPKESFWSLAQLLQDSYSLKFWRSMLDISWQVSLPYGNLVT